MKKLRQLYSEVEDKIEGVLPLYDAIKNLENFHAYSKYIYFAS